MLITALFLGRPVGQLEPIASVGFPLVLVFNRFLEFYAAIEVCRLRYILQGAYLMNVIAY